MPFFDNIRKKIARTGQNVAENTLSFAETARISAQIAEEQKQITALYVQLGSLFYETYGSNAEEPIQSICLRIGECFEKISLYESEIARIKGIKLCIACGLELPRNAAFCSGCGAPVPKPPEAPATELVKSFCPGCGSQLIPGAAFCVSCGQKI